jgi:predicted secreted protein
VSPVSALAIYFIIWWLCLFVVLPFGIKSQHETNHVAPGTEHGAPQQPLLLRKALATTLLSALIFMGVYLYFGVYEMSLQDLLP